MGFASKSHANFGLVLERGPGGPLGSKPRALPDFGSQPSCENLAHPITADALDRAPCTKNAVLATWDASLGLDSFVLSGLAGLIGTRRGQQNQEKPSTTALNIAQADHVSAYMYIFANQNLHFSVFDKG